MRPRLLLAVGALLPAALFLLPENAGACSICPGPNLGGLTVEHPAALRIGLATRKALEENQLPTPKKPSASDTAPALAPEVMPGWALLQRILPAGQRATVGELLLVDNGGRRLLLARGEKRRDPQIRIVTTSTTLHALLRQQITLDQAREADLILVEPVAPATPAAPANGS